MEGADTYEGVYPAQETEPGKLSFGWKLQEGKSLPAKYSLFIGLKHSGTVIAKSLAGIGHFPFANVEFARGGAFAKAFVHPEGNLVTLAAEDELPYDRQALCEVFRTELFTNADKVLIIESLPSAIALKLSGGTGLDEERNHFFEYQTSQDVKIKETLGYELFRTAEEAFKLAGAPQQKQSLYLQHVTSETSLTFPDLQELVAKLASLPLLSASWKLTVNESRLKSALKYALQSLPYT